MNPNWYNSNTKPMSPGEYIVHFRRFSDYGAEINEYSVEEFDGISWVDCPNGEIIEWTPMMFPIAG